MGPYQASSQELYTSSLFESYRTDLILLQLASQGSANLLADVVASRPPAKVDETTRRVSLTLPVDAEAAAKHAQGTTNTQEPLSQLADDDDEYPAPTEEEKGTLRKVPAHIRLVSFSLCLVEFAERASYYGAKTVFNNFIQFPLPEGTRP